MRTCKIGSLIVGITYRAIIGNTDCVPLENFSFNRFVLSIPYFRIGFNSAVVSKTRNTIVAIRSPYKRYISLVKARRFLIVKTLLNIKDFHKVKFTPFAV